MFLITDLDKYCHSICEEEVDLGIAGWRGYLPHESGDVTTRPVSEGWGKEYTPTYIDFDDSQCGSHDSHLNVNVDSFNSMDFINLFVDEQFWQSLTDMTNLQATKLKGTATTNDFY